MYIEKNMFNVRSLYHNTSYIILDNSSYYHSYSSMHSVIGIRVLRVIVTYSINILPIKLSKYMANTGYALLHHLLCVVNVRTNANKPTTQLQKFSFCYHKRHGKIIHPSLWNHNCFL